MSDTNGTGIYVQAQVPGTVLRGNQVRDNDRSGIYVGADAIADIEGGVVERNSQNDDGDDPAGIVFDRRSVGSVTGTTIRDNTGAGIAQELKANVRISQVSCSGNSGEGIAVFAVDPRQAGKKGVQPEPPSELSFDEAAKEVKGKALPGATVEVYRVEDGPRTGNPAHGEGKTFLAAGLADADGMFSIEVVCSEGELLTLTTTRPGKLRSTSEFSADVECEGAAIELVSVSSAGTPGDDRSTLGTHAARAMSADGRFVVFTSTATNLIPGDTNERTDVFLRDRTAGTTVRVSLRHDGSQIAPDTQFVITEGSSSEGSVSDDGRYVAFTSYADDVVPGDPGNLEVHTYLRDVVAGTTVAVSGPEDHSAGYDASISGDGRFVAFISVDPDWDANDDNGTSDVFVWDRTTGGVELVSRTTGGLPSTENFNAAAQSPRLSSDGRFVVFRTAHTLTPGDTVSGLKVFVRDRQAGTTELVSRTSAGVPALGASPSISADGRYVAFTSLQSLVSEDTNATGDVYVLDRTQDTLVLASRDPAGALFLGSTGATSLSGVGRFVAFVAPGGYDSDGFTLLFSDVYVRDLVLGVTVEAAVGPAGDADDSGDAPCLDGTGRFVVFASRGSNLVPGDAPFAPDVFVRTLR